MSNHIAAKFLVLNYAPVPQKSFSEKIEKLTDALRPDYPRYETPAVGGITVNVSDDNISAEKNTQGQELHMVDADGLYGFKIGNQGIILSTSSYVAFETVLEHFLGLIDSVDKILNITHFSRVGLRNINLFQSLERSDNEFEDIKDSAMWGRQDFACLKDAAYKCNGAATRHEYISPDFTSIVNISSSVVKTGQSYIPQDDWNIWKMRGGIPAVSEQERAKLLIDIDSLKLQYPLNNPEKQNNLSEYSKEAVATCVREIHEIVNEVYNDIAED